MIHPSVLSLIMVFISIITFLRQSLIPWTLLILSLFCTIFKQVEHFNDIFAYQIAKLCNPDPMGWDVYFSSAVYTYNTNVHAVTKFIPTNLHLFAHRKVPLILLLLPFPYFPVMAFSHDTGFFHCFILPSARILWIVIWDAYFKNSELSKSIYTMFFSLCDYILYMFSVVIFLFYSSSHTQ